MLSRVDFGKGFFDKAIRQDHQGDRKAFLFKGSFASITGLTRALGLENTHTRPRFYADDVLDPTGFDQQHYTFSFVRRSFSVRYAPGSSTFIQARVKGWAVLRAYLG